MGSIVYSRQAKSDLFEIADYIAEKNPIAADALLSTIYRSCEQLADFPLSGQPRNDIMTGLRHLVCGHYLILYFPRDGIIDIARIIHGARSLQDLL